MLEENFEISVNPKQETNSKASYDLHPSKELSDAYNFNVLWIFYTLLFEVLLLVMYPKWSVAGVLMASGYIPLIMNTVWLLLPYRHKRYCVISNKIT